MHVVTPSSEYKGVEVPAAIDETGKQYNRLLVLSRTENHHSGLAMWLCKCDCGNEVVVTGRNLRTGNTQSCGCFHRDRTSETQTVDLTGKVFSRLRVISRRGSLGNNAAWLCQCECGKRTVVASLHLNSGHTKSCGCLVHNRLPEGESGFNRMLGGIQYQAEKRGYIWDLTREQARTLTSQDCYYCGVPPRQVMGEWHGKYTYNGIDRMDNDLGYTVDNCVPCCRECNWAKGTKSVRDFIAWAHRVIDTANRMEQYAEC